MRDENRTVLKRMIAAMVIVLMMSAAAFGQQTKGTQSMDEMVVTATRSEERAIDVPVTTQVIDREKIEMSGALDIGDLIGKYITGHFHKYNGLLSPVGLRGFRTESHGDDIKGYVLLLVDGHRVGTGNAAKINMDRIERIEVTKGPASALYGSAAMGGVINLITKKGDGDLFASIGGDAGSFDYYKGQLSGGGEVNERFRFHATASYEDTDDYDDPEFGTVYNTGVTRKNVGGNLVFTVNDYHELRFGGNYADLTSETPDWDGDAYTRYREDANQHNDKSHAYADLEYNGDYFGSKLHWRGLAYYLRDKNHWNYGDPVAESEQVKYIDETLGTDHQFNWHMASWNKLLVGFNLEWLEKESEGVSDGQPSTPYTPGMEYDTQALFAQDSLDLWDNRINIIAAVRYDRFDVTTVRPKTGDLPDFNERNEVYDHVSPKVGIGVKVIDEFLRLRANVGEGFKSPSADQLSADYIHSNGTHYLGNPDLDPETSLTYDVGVDLFHEFFSLQVGYFHTDFEDKIVRVTDEVDGDAVTTYENHGDSEMAGFDVNFQWWIDRMFDWTIGVSVYSNAAFNTTKDDKETGEDLQYISDYEVKSGVSISYAGFSTQLSHVLVGPQMITNSDTYEDEEKGSFDFWDLTLRYRFLNHWEVRGSVLNLFDDQVEWVRGYLMPERNYRVGLTYTF